MSNNVKFGLQLELKGDKVLVRGLDKARGSVGGLGQQVDESRTSFRGLTDTLFSLKGAIAGLGIGLVARELIQTQTSVQQITRTLNAATGSLAAGSAELAFVEAEAERLGLQIDSTAKSYAQLVAASKGTNLEGQNTREIFVAVSEAATALGLSAADAEGTLRAVQQMMSKGTVQAEELRGQLGDRIPGAFNLMARGLRVNTAQLNKMLEQGQVLAEEALPALARELRKTYSGAALEGSVQLAANINRLSNSTRALKIEILDSGIGDLLNDSVKLATASVALLGENLDELTTIAQGVAVVVGARMVNAFLVANDAQLQYYNQLARGNVSSINGTKAEIARANVLRQSAAAALQKAQAQTRLAAVNVILNQSTVNSLKAEILLEQRRLRAQITDQGRQAAIQRMTAAKRELTVATAALSQAETVHAANLQAETAAQARATAATNTHTAAKQRATVVNRAFAASTRLATSALGLLGGPLGVAMLAGFALWEYTRRADGAAEVTRRTSGDVAVLASEMSKLTRVEIQSSIAKQTAEFEKADAQVKALANTYAGVEKILNSGQAMEGSRVQRLKDTLDELGKSLAEAGDRGADAIIKIRAAKQALAALDETDARAEAARKDTVAKLLEELSLLQFQHRLLLQGMPIKEADNLVEEVSQRLKLAKQGLSQAEIQSYMEAITAIREKTEAQQAELDLQKSINAFLERDFSAPIEGFDQVSRAIVGAVDSLHNLVNLQDEYGKLRKAADGDADKLAAIEKKRQKEQIGLYGDITASAKQFFKEGSSGYKALEKAERAFRAIEIGMAVANLTAKLALMATETTAVVTNASIKATAEGTANVASSGVGIPFPYNIAAMVATLAFLSSMGVNARGGSGGGGRSAIDDLESKLTQVPASAGISSLSIADQSEMAEGAANALDIIADLSKEQNAYLAEMTRSLRNLETASSTAATQFVRGGFPSGQVNLGGESIHQVLYGQLSGNFVSQTTLLLEQRLSELRAELAIENTKKAAKQGSKLIPYITGLINAAVGDLARSQTGDAAINQGNKGFINSIEQGLSSAYKLIETSIANLGLGLQTHARNYRLPSLSLDAAQGKEEIRDQLSAYFDRITGDILASGSPLISGLQQLGEGAIETLTRVTAQTEILKDFGRTVMGQDTSLNPEIYIQVGDALANMAGGVSNFGSNVSSLIELLTTDQQALQNTDAAVRSLFNTFGYEVPATLEDLKEFFRNFPDARNVNAQELFTTLSESTDLLEEYYNRLERGLDRFRAEFFSQEEQFAFLTQELVDEFSLLGLVLPETRDQFRALVESLDLANASEKSLYSALLNLVPLADEYFDTLESTAGAIDGVSGSLNKLIGVSENLRNFLDRLSRTQGGTPIEQQAESLRQFREAGGLALSGDADAASSLQNLAQDLINSSRAAFASGSAFQAVMDEVRSTIQNVIDSVGVPGADSAAVPGFAVGGDHAGGIRLVGERGPELELTGPSRIFSADQTAAILRSGQDSSGVVVAINRHRAETEHQTRLQMSAQRQVVGQLRSINKRVVDLESELATARVTR